ncbi:Alpha/Beta hydrolase protein [Rhypophila decipiens]
MLAVHIPCLAILVLGSASLSSAAAVPRAPQCSSVTFYVSAAIDNAALSLPPDPNNGTQIVEFIERATSGQDVTNGTQSVSGNYSINAIYCRPAGATPARDALQILVHGYTYNSTMWSGLGFGEQYDWQAYAMSQGYHTLAIDRVGHGTNPRHPDPLNEVQGPLHVETIHQLITAIRQDTPSNALDRPFTQIAYVGHSFGSFIGGALARLHPSDVDALVLTAYSTSPNGETIASMKYTPAATLFPGRFPSEEVAKGYVTMASESQRESLLYSGAYDKRIPPVDFAYEDTVTVGEITALGFALAPSVGYKGPVMVVTGVEDSMFCTPPQETCEDILAAAGQFFPDAKEYRTLAVPDTGYDLTLHLSAGETMQKVNEFLGSVFRDGA